VIPIKLSGFDIDQLVQEAKTRWLKPPEVLFILQNYEQYQITQQAPQKPPSNFYVISVTVVFSSMIPMYS